MTLIHFARKLPENLESEQKVVRDRITSTARSWEVIVVQGVAGSGKTTVALYAIRDFVRGNEQFMREGLTPIYVTQSSNLVQACRALLATDLRPELLAPTDEIQPGKLNILTMAKLFEQVAPSTESPRQLLSDDSCLEIVTDLIARRGRTRTALLPSQAYAVLTAFLKGRSDLRDKNLEETRRLAASLVEADTYADSIAQVREFYLKEYTEELVRRGAKDRIDLVWEIHEALLHANSQFDFFCKLDRSASREKSRREMVDQLKPLHQWLTGFLKALSECDDAAPDDRERAVQFQTAIRKREHSMWEELRESVKKWVGEYGMLGSPVIKHVGKKLRYPVFLVDEVQDLAQVEWSTLARLYFHLTRKAKRSRLVFLGDQNQQVMPTGFRWEDMFGFLRNEAQRFNYDDDRFYSITTLRDADEDRAALGPYLILRNNYRTSEEIAAFAHGMGVALAPAIFGPARPDQQRRYKERLIDPQRSLLYSEEVEQDYNQVPQDFLEPQVVIATRENFVAAVKQSLEKVPTAGRSDEGLVLITRDPTRLENEIGSRGERVACYTPLSCKGLEFRSVNVVDLPRKEPYQGHLELDVAAQWYCAVTRPRVVLALFLTEEEVKYLEACGWPLDQMLKARIRRNASTEECLAVLQHTHTKHIDTPELAESYLTRFRDAPRVRWRLDRALHIYESLGDLNGLRRAERTGAVTFEMERMFSDARDYYKKAGDPIGRARCFRLEIQQLRNEGRLHDANRLLDEARAFAEGEGTAGSGKLYEIWWELGEFGRALELCLRMGDLEKAEEIARKIEDSAEQRKALQRVAQHYRNAGQEEKLPVAYRLFWEIELQDRCKEIDVLLRTQAPHLLRRCYQETKQTSSLEELASLLATEKKFEQAAACLEAANNLEEATSRWYDAMVDLEARVCELCGVEVAGGVADWYRNGLRDWLRKILGPPQLLTIPQETIAPLQRLNEQLKPSAFLQMSTDEAASVRAAIAEVHSIRTRSMMWIKELSDFASDLEARTTGVAEGSQGLQERLAQVREYAVGETDFPADLDLLRVDLNNLVGWYGEQVTMRARHLWEQALPAKKGETLERAYFLEDRVRERLRRSGRDGEGELLSLNQQVQLLWSNGGVDDMLLAARCWMKIGEYGRRQLEARISTDIPGVLRTVEKSPNRYAERVLSLDCWADAMLRLQAQFPSLTAKPHAIGVLKRWADPAGGDHAQREEALRVLMRYFPEASPQLSPAAPHLVDLTALLEELGQAVASSPNLKADREEVGAFLRSALLLFKKGKLTRGDATWGELRKQLLEESKPLPEMVLQIDQQLQSGSEDAVGRQRRRDRRR